MTRCVQPVNSTNQSGGIFTPAAARWIWQANLVLVILLALIPGHAHARLVRLVSMPQEKETTSIGSCLSQQHAKDFFMPRDWLPCPAISEATGSSGHYHKRAAWPHLVFCCGIGQGHKALAARLQAGLWVLLVVRALPRLQGVLAAIFGQCREEDMQFASLPGLQVEPLLKASAMIQTWWRAGFPQKGVFYLHKVLWAFGSACCHLPQLVWSM